jgi:hypothetical protein
VHAEFGDMKQVLDDVSQQLVPLDGAGQLFWQSLSVWQVVTHIVPPPEPLLVPVLEFEPLPLDDPPLL